MTKQRQQDGQHGEVLAAEQLITQGYAILARNYRCKLGEIDLIAAKSGIIYFVEVKAKQNSDFTNPATNVNRRKRWHIAQVAMHWFAHHGGEQNSSFLVAEVDLSKNQVFFIEDFLR